MNQQRKSSFIATRGWEINDQVEQNNFNPYSILARSLERNLKNYIENNKVSSQKSIEKIQAFGISRRTGLIKKRYNKILSEQKELPIIAKGNKEILVVRTIEMEQKLKQSEQKEEKAVKYFSINLLTLPRSDKNQSNQSKIQQKQQIQDKLQRQSNKKYDRIRQHRANKTSRRLFLYFKSKDEMQTLTEETLEKYLLQRTKKNSLEHSNVFSLPTVSR